MTIRERALRALGWTTIEAENGEDERFSKPLWVSPSGCQYKAPMLPSDAELIGMLMVEFRRLRPLAAASIAVSHLGAVIEALDRSSGRRTTDALEALVLAVEAAREGK